MQLTKISDKLRPLTLAAGIISAASLYTCSAVDCHSGIMSIATNNRTSEHFKAVDQDNNAFLREIQFKFHLENWETKTSFFSSPTMIIEDDDFKAIIAMGHSAVPYIMNEIDRKPSTLVWALNIIFQKKITDNPNATISDACKLWVKTLKNG